ncbi:MAG: hypothetical protein ACKO9H_02745, partial [Planctomycetota bacterium]
MSSASPLIPEFDSQSVMLRDRHRLQSWRDRLRRQPAEEQASALAKWLAAYEEAQKRLQLRSERLPQPRLDSSLPVAERGEEIRAALAKHQVLVLSGETGSGKSTQIPLIALQLGIGKRGL